MTDAIKIAIQHQDLPTDGASFLASLIEKDGKFISQESAHWDFKREWPFSYSDDYFGGIARLICAFANANGGLIIFGVHDELRTAGHNKVAPNLDRLQQALKQLLSDAPKLVCRRYNEGSSKAIDILLVCPHTIGLPLRFVRPLGKYKSGVIWIRQNHEVVAAEPRHVGLLYCRSSINSDFGEDDTLSGGLPPSPATIKRFVGRLNTIDRIFSWLKLSDEPRTFLYGKGGSGKTTIAYEVAKTIKLFGQKSPIFDGETLDNVIFVSAKQSTLNVIDQSTQAFVGMDFSNERELYEAILTLGNWTSKSLDSLSTDNLKSELRMFFDLTANFIVIDDIDTLTTKGIEAGFDFLYSILWRSKRRSKILYTIRNAPSQSLANSIEVPGLEDGDYEEFVQVCSNQFRVHPPTSDFMATKLSVVSERRPLVIESIIALRRTAGDYVRAVHLFEEGSGEDVRNYVFQREWNSLPADNYGRYILAVLALYGEPITFADIIALTRYEERRVSDALADVREMFLQLNDIGKETTFQLGALTRAFVFEQSKKLDLYGALKERVDKYKRNFYPTNPVLSRLCDRVEALVLKGRRFFDREATTEALQLVMDKTLSAKITEDPRFMALQAYVFATQTPPNLEDARRLFGHVFAMKFEPDTLQLKAWFQAERDSGHGLDQCVRIADLVCQGKKYSDDDKIEFLARKGTCLYNRGRNDVGFSPDSAVADIREALRCHLSCYEKNMNIGSMKADKSEEYARNTGFYLFSFLVQHARHDAFFDVALELIEGGFKLDPVEEPLINAFRIMQNERPSKHSAPRVKGRLDYFKRELLRKGAWYDQSAQVRVVSAAEQTVRSLSEKSG